ncbi:MAG TPA: hypothetical protein VFQ32_11880 [Ktedonobacterales bacterium]|nr:hypothetical protein [Ktedonobacterales bacterium]
MIIAEPQWLHTLGQIAGTLLMLELCFVLLLVCVIVGALSYASWWLHHNVIPVLDEYGGQAQHYMGIARQGSDRVVGGVAEFHGRWEAITTGARVMLFGTRNGGRPALPARAAADATAATREIARENIPTAPAVPDVSETPDPNARDAQ